MDHRRNLLLHVTVDWSTLQADAASATNFTVAKNFHLVDTKLSEIYNLRTL